MSSPAASRQPWAGDRAKGSAPNVGSPRGCGCTPQTPGRALPPPAALPAGDKESLSRCWWIPSSPGYPRGLQSSVGGLKGCAGLGARGSESESVSGELWSSVWGFVWAQNSHKICPCCHCFAESHAADRPGRCEKLQTGCPPVQHPKLGQTGWSGPGLNCGRGPRMSPRAAPAVPVLALPRPLSTAPRGRSDPIWSDLVRSGLFWSGLTAEGTMEMELPHRWPQPGRGGQRGEGSPCPWVAHERCPHGNYAL